MRPQDADAVAFVSDQFDLNNSVMSTVELPVGIVELSAFLATELSRHAAVEAQAEIDDSWCIVYAKVNQQRFLVYVYWWPGEDCETRWRLEFHKPRGCLVALFSKLPPAHETCSEIMSLVDAVLQNHPDTFDEIRWLSGDDYERDWAWMIGGERWPNQTDSQ